MVLLRGKDKITEKLIQMNELYIKTDYTSSSLLLPRAKGLSVVNNVIFARLPERITSIQLVFNRHNKHKGVGTFTVNTVEKCLI